MLLEGGFSGPRESTLQIEAIEVLGCSSHDLFDLTLRHRGARLRSQDLHDFIERAFGRFLGRAPANAEGVSLRREIQLGVQREQRLSSSGDRKSTRLNSSHDQISYAVF